MTNLNLTAPLAWAALVSEFDNERTVVVGQHGAFEAVTVDTPTVDIVAHDLEAERWEAATEWLGLAIDEMFEDAAREALVREVLDAQEEMPRLRETLTTPTVFDQEDTIEAEQLTIPEPSPTIPQAFEQHGAAFEPSHDGRYVIATCERCKWRAAGPVHLATDAMEEHAATHATRKATKVTQPTPPTKEVATKRKPRCPRHGVWAREDDGRCKRCDEPTRDPEALAKNETLLKVLAELLAQQPERVAKVTQDAQAAAPASVTLGVRGNGYLARRSAHALAELTGVPQRDLAKLTADEARAFVQERGIDAKWVPAAELV